MDRKLDDQQGVPEKDGEAVEAEVVEVSGATDAVEPEVVETQGPAVEPVEAEVVDADVVEEDPMAAADRVQGPIESPEGPLPGQGPAPRPQALPMEDPKAAKARGQRNANKVYNWLGFIGGAFAVAFGFAVLFCTVPDTTIRFGGDFYTEVYHATADIAQILRFGFFGLLEAVGLGLLGHFGPILMRADANE